MPFICFSSIISGSKWDSTNLSTVRKISENKTNALVYKLKHLMNVRENVNVSWQYPFVVHSRFSYWAYILYRERLLGLGNFYIKQTFGENLLTINELVLQNGTYSKVTNKIQYSQKVFPKQVHIGIDKGTAESSIKSGCSNYSVLDIILCRIPLTRISYTIRKYEEPSAL